MAEERHERLLKLIDEVGGTCIDKSLPGLPEHWREAGSLNPEDAIRFLSRSFSESRGMRAMLKKAGYDISEPQQLALF